MASRSLGGGDYCSQLPFAFLGGLGGPSPRAGPSVCLEGERGGWAEAGSAGLFPRALSSPGLSTSASQHGWDSVGAMEDRGPPWASGSFAQRRSRACSCGPELLGAEERRESPFSARAPHGHHWKREDVFPKLLQSRACFSCTELHLILRMPPPLFFFFFPFPEPKNAVKLSVTGTSYQT